MVFDSPVDLGNAVGSSKVSVRRRKKGNVKQARADYETAIKDLNYALATTKCDHRKRKIDETIKKVTGRLQALKSRSEPSASKPKQRESGTRICKQGYQKCGDLCCVNLVPCSDVQIMIQQGKLRKDACY